MRTKFKTMDKGAEEVVKTKDTSSLEVFEGNIKTVEDSHFKIIDEGELRVIEGYFTTIDVDRGNDISLPSAFEKTMKSFMDAGGVICYMHDWEKPLGKVLSYKIDEKGVWIRGEIAKGVDYVDDAWKLMKQGVLKCFSYGYRTLDSGLKKIGEKIVQELKEVDLLEITIATVPMNNKATFVVTGGVKTMILHDGKSMENFIKSLIEQAASFKAQTIAENITIETVDVKSFEEKLEVKKKVLIEELTEQEARQKCDIYSIFWTFYRNLLDISPSAPDAQKQVDSLVDELSMIYKERMLQFLTYQNECYCCGKDGMTDEVVLKIIEGEKYKMAGFTKLDFAPEIKVSFQEEITDKGEIKTDEGGDEEFIAKVKDITSGLNKVVETIIKTNKKE